MGCVSSKLVKKEIDRERFFNNGGDSPNHVVSLTSTTYGLLKLDDEPIKEIAAEAKKVQRSPPRDDPEVINAWELMKDLEDGVPISSQAKKSPKSPVFLRGVGGKDARTPLKFLNRIGSPRKVKRSGGKENVNQINGVAEFTPKSILKHKNSLETPCKKVLNLSIPLRSAKSECLDGDFGFSSRRKSFSPLFDPELVALYEKELSEEGDQIKRIISATPEIRKAIKFQESEGVLNLFEKISPPGGEKAVVIYTTTLRGIRKTFEDCNMVRAILESHQVQVFERDISMDSGFKEELRKLKGTKDVKVPILFVKGRLIGGAEEVMKLEEEGKLGALFNGLPRAIPGCGGCAGVRFVMCVRCNGSCKILDKDQKKIVKCSECNENGLIQCPICC